MPYMSLVRRVPTMLACALAFAGVRVLRVPGGIAVQIRGASSITGSNEPVYVVDGQRMMDAGPRAAADPPKGSFTQRAQRKTRGRRGLRQPLRPLPSPLRPLRETAVPQPKPRIRGPCLPRRAPARAPCSSPGRPTGRAFTTEPHSFSPGMQEDAFEWLRRWL
jgi:hypothetical protein